jgi:hypothetical protein
MCVKGTVMSPLPRADVDAVIGDQEPGHRFMVRIDFADTGLSVLTFFFRRETVTNMMRDYGSDAKVTMWPLHTKTRKGRQS